MGRRQINVMISTDPNGQGGVASVVKAMLGQQFSLDWNIKHIVSHSAGSKLMMMWVFALAFLKLGLMRLTANPGIAHIHLASRGSFSRKYWLARFAKILGFKVLIHLHGGQFNLFYERECSAHKQRKVAHLFNSANAIVVLGEQWKCWVCETFPQVRDVRIIYNFGPSTVVASKTASTPTILFLGRLSDKKGVLDLLYALPTVIANVPNVTLVIAGDGDISHYQKQAQSLGIAAHVEFKGWVGPTEKFKLLSEAAVFALPSYSEGFPVGIIEAMAYGLPVVASTVGGIPDAITHGVDGLLIKAGDIASLSESLNQILSLPQLANDLGQNAQQKYSERFSCAAVMPRWHALYMEIING